MHGHNNNAFCPIRGRKTEPAKERDVNKRGRKSAQRETNLSSNSNLAFVHVIFGFCIINLPHPYHFEIRSQILEQSQQIELEILISNFWS